HFTPSSGKSASSICTVLASRLTPEAPAFSSSWARLVAPTMQEATVFFERHQARESWPGLRRLALAIFFRAATRDKMAGESRGLIHWLRLPSAAREPAGAFLDWYLPVKTPWARGE